MKKITDKELQTIIDDVQAEMSQHIKAFKMEGETDLLGTLNLAEAVARTRATLVFLLA